MFLEKVIRLQKPPSAAALVVSTRRQLVRCGDYEPIADPPTTADVWPAFCSGVVYNTAVTSKKRQPRSNRTAPAPTGGGSPPWILIGGVVAVVALGGFAFVTSSDEAASGTDDHTMADADAAPEFPVRDPPPPAPANRTPVPPADAPIPPLPQAGAMIPRSAEVIRDAYIFAAQRPDILEFVPCFCGCETAGHARNADCFVGSRNADGTVREWDTHGLGCIICVDVAREAMQLHASGAALTDIRDIVEEKYAPYPNHTPTPAPPAN